MTLSEKQRRFTELLRKLLEWLDTNGYEVTLGEAYRTPEQAALNAQKGTGITNSLHTKRLAIDLNLFRDGEFLQTKEDYQPAGEYWESLDPEASWGGRFTRPDSDHFSLSDGGVR